MPFGAPLHLPEVPTTQRAEARVDLRYEDVLQSGHVRPEALVHGMGSACWRGLLTRHPLRAVVREEGILAILTRIEVSVGEGPVPVSEPIEASGGYRFGHELDERGEPRRILLELSARLHGRAGRTHGPPPPHHGARIEVGRVRAEHVFTRPFAPAGRHRVTRLPSRPGVDPVPGEPMRWAPPEQSGTLPTGCLPLEASPRPDAVPLVFGLGDTDSNHHVNSLVYPRRFEEAALRRLRELGHDAALRPLALEVAYRKPTFAGEQLLVELHAFEYQGRLGAAGRFFSPSSGRTHAFARMLFATRDDETVHGADGDGAGGGSR